VVAIIGVLAAIALPMLLRARMSTNEASAMSTLRSIYGAQFAYASLCGRSGYAADLPTLAVPPDGALDPFLSPDLTYAATVTKSGFSVTMNAAGFPAGANDCNGTPTVGGYYASAAPLDGTTGARSFAITHAGAIYYLNGLTPPDPAESGSPIR
jgi:type II secretory pathway pseudopilin PulG